MTPWRAIRLRIEWALVEWPGLAHFHAYLATGGPAWWVRLWPFTVVIFWRHETAPARRILAREAAERKAKRAAQRAAEVAT